MNVIRSLGLLGFAHRCEMTRGHRTTSSTRDAERNHSLHGSRRTRALILVHELDERLGLGDRGRAPDRLPPRTEHAVPPTDLLPQSLASRDTRHQ